MTLDPPNMRRMLIEAITHELRDHLCIECTEMRKSLRCPTTGEALAIAHAAIRPIETFLKTFKEMQEISLQLAMAAPPPHIVYLQPRESKPNIESPAITEIPPSENTPRCVR